MSNMELEGEPADRFGRLVRGYASLVSAVARGYDDYIEEYANDIDTRTIIEQMLRAGFVPEGELAGQLRDLDARFVSLLAPIRRPLGTAGTGAQTHFWWLGLPRNMAGDLLRDAIELGYVGADWPGGASGAEPSDQQ